MKLVCPEARGKRQPRAEQPLAVMHMFARRLARVRHMVAATDGMGETYNVGHWPEDETQPLAGRI